MYTGKVRITPVCVGKSLIGLVEYMTKEDNPTYEWKRYVLLQTATDTLDNPHVCVEKLLIQRTVFQVKEDNPVFMGKYKFGQEITMTTDNTQCNGKNVLLLYQSEQQSG